MASSTISTMDAVLKQIYKPEFVEFNTYRDRPLFGMLKKVDDFEGRNYPVPIIYGNPQGVSPDFATAQSNASAVLTEDFLLTRVTQYSVATITGETVRAMKSDKGSFIRGLKTKIDTAMDALSDSLESNLFRTGTGALAQAGTISTVTVTLKDVYDINNFEVNMELVAAATETGALRTGSATITGINYSDGQLTSDSNWTSQITSFAADDFLFMEGSAQAGGSVKCVSGLAQWVEESGALFGVTRTAHGRLTGLSYDGSSDTNEEALIRMDEVIARQGGRPDCVLVNNAQYRKLIVELGSKKEYNHVNATNAKGTVANIGYKAVVVDGQKGPLDVVPCNKCQSTKGWMLTKSSFTFATLGKPVAIAREDGLRIQRQASADGYEVRIYYHGQLGCNSPVWNGVVTFASP